MVIGIGLTLVVGDSVDILNFNLYGVIQHITKILNQNVQNITQNLLEMKKVLSFRFQIDFIEEVDHIGSDHRVKVFKS